MEKRYSIIEAFKSTVATLLMHKKEFLKLLAVDIVLILSITCMGMLQIASAAKIVLFVGTYFLIIVFALTSLIMFFQAFKGEKVSFIEALNKATTVKMIRRFVAFWLMAFGTIIAFMLPLIGLISLVNVFAGIYAYIINIILIVVYLLPGFYYGGRYSMFAISALVNGSPVIESVKESYKLTPLKFLWVFFGFSFIVGLIVGLIGGAITVIFNHFTLPIVALVLVSLLGVLIKPLMHGITTNLYLQLKNQ